MANYSPGNPFAQKKYSPDNPFTQTPAELPPEPAMLENSHKPPIDPNQAMIDSVNSRDDTTLKQLGKGFMDPVYGASKLVAKGVEATTGQESPIFSDEMMRQREANYKAEVPEGRSAVIEGVGMAANPLMWMGPGKTKIAGQVLTGTMKALGKHTSSNALQAMTIPVNPDEDYWKTQAGRAAFGALIGTVVSGTGAGLSQAQKLLMSRISDAPGQATRYLKELFGADAPEVARQLDNLSSNIPGEKPTVGWLSTLEKKRWPAGAAIEKEARGHKLTAGMFNVRDEENKAAQLALMDKMRQGGVRPTNAAGRTTPSVFERNASRNAGPLYDTASQEMIYVPEKLKQAIQGKEAIQAARQGQDFISQAELNTNAGLSSRTPSPGPIRGGEVGSPTPTNIDTWNQDQWRNRLPMESIGSLHTQRKSMDSLIRASNNTTDPNAIEAARLLREVKGGLTDRMRKASPTFDVAEQTFINEIAPQNRADYITALRNKFDGPEGLNQIGLLNALRDPTKTARSAGIPFKVDSTQQLMGQGNAGARRMSQIDALKKAAERDLALRGVYAPEKIKGDFTDIGQEMNRTLPPYLSSVVTSSKRLADLVGKKMTKGRGEVIAEAALEPAEMAKLLRAASPEDRSALWNMLRSMDKTGVRPITGVLRSEMSKEFGGPE